MCNRRVVRLKVATEVSSVWLSEIKFGYVHEWLALGSLLHFAWFSEIFGFLSLSDVYFDFIIPTEIRPTVNFHNAMFNIKYSTFCPHSVFMCFVWI